MPKPLNNVDLIKYYALLLGLDARADSLFFGSALFGF